MPPIEHTYGKSPKKDKENAKEVTMSWNYHNQSKEKELARDFMQMNVNSLKDGKIKVNDITHWRKE